MGLAGGRDVLWASQEAVELASAAGGTVGDLVLARLQHADESPAEALVQTMDTLAPLIHKGVLALS